jgi:hypothetical protein
MPRSRRQKDQGPGGLRRTPPRPRAGQTMQAADHRQRPPSGCMLDVFSTADHTHAPGRPHWPSSASLIRSQSGRHSLPDSQPSSDPGAQSDGRPAHHQSRSPTPPTRHPSNPRPRRSGHAVIPPAPGRKPTRWFARRSPPSRSRQVSGMGSACGRRYAGGSGIPSDLHKGYRTVSRGDTIQPQPRPPVSPLDTARSGEARSDGIPLRPPAW